MILIISLISSHMTTLLVQPASLTIWYQKQEFFAENPNLGETKIPKLPSVRIFPHGNYLLLFLPLENLQGIELLRIIHGARDYANYLLDDF